ncbi:MAG: hypothetical protein N2383_03340 [Caldilineales bacterium]|nr:hypothetical protein [Caldilineales bacterium]
MTLWIDIEDEHGRKLGPGPLTQARNWHYTARVDAAGEFGFEVPLADPLASQLQLRRCIRAWTVLADGLTCLGAGRIERLERRGDQVLVSGGDLLRELADRHVGDLWLADTVCEHAARVGAFVWSGQPYESVWRELSEVTDYAVGDTSTYYHFEHFHQGWIGGNGNYFIYIGHLRQFHRVDFVLGPQVNTAPGDWRVQYFDIDKFGWYDLDITANTTKVGNTWFAQSGYIEFTIPETWTLEGLYSGPIYDIRISQWCADEVTFDLADVAVSYTQPTTAGLVRIMAQAPDTWNLDGVHGYLATQPPQPVAEERLRNGHWATYSGTPDDGVTDVFADWSNSGADANHRLEATTYGGDHVLKIVAGTAGRPCIAQTVNVNQVDHLLTLRTASDGAAQLLWRLSDADTGRTLTGWIYTNLTAPTWTTYQRRFAVPPNVSRLTLELTATVGVVYVDAVSLQEVNAGEVYLEFAQESVLEALNRLAEQTGEHFIAGYGGSREVVWLGFDRPASAVYAVGGTPQAAMQERPEVAVLLSLAEVGEASELASRVYPYGAAFGNRRITLAACTRAAPAGYALNPVENYIERLDVAYGRRDKVLEYPDIVCYEPGQSAQRDAANMLFDRALTWLRLHSCNAAEQAAGQLPKVYELTLLSQRPLYPGHSLRVTWVEWRDDTPVRVLDDTLWLSEVRQQQDANGALRWQVTAANTVWLERDDAEALAQETRLNRAVRRRPHSIAAAGGSLIPAPTLTDHAALRHLDFAESGHTGFQAEYGPQTARTVLAGPTSGAPATPTFRALLPADLPATTVFNPLTADLDFAGFQAIAMACHRGTTFPTNPTTGQWFFHTTAQVLFQYSGTAWKPLVGFANLNLYVDDALGSDAVGQGLAPGSGATKTIQYALNNLVPPLTVASVEVTIWIAAGTYIENINVPYSTALVRLSGAYTAVATGTATGVYVTGTTSNPGATQTGTISTPTGGSTTVTVNGGTTANCYPGQIIFATTDPTKAALITQVVDNTTLQIDRVLDLSGGYAWGVAGATYIDANAVWSDDQYNGHFLIYNRSGDAGTDATRAYPIMATSATRKSLTVGARPYTNAANGQPYSIARLDTVLQGTVTGAASSNVVLRWLRVAPTASDAQIVVVPRYGNWQLYACHVVGTVNSFPIYAVVFPSRLVFSNSYLSGQSFIGIYIINGPQAIVQWSWLNLQNNNSSYGVIRIERTSVCTLSSNVILNVTYRCGGEAFSLGTINFTTCCPMLRMGGTHSTAFLVRAGGTANNAAAQYNSIYGYSTPWDVQTQSFGSADYPTYPLNLAEQTATPTAATDLVRLYALNQNNEAGNEALHVLSEANYLLKFGNRLAAGGGRQKAVRTVSGTVTATVADYILLADATAGRVTINLPTAASAWDSGLNAGSELVVKKIDNTGNPVVLDAAGSELIDGSLIYTLVAPQAAVTIVSNGSGWYVAQQVIPPLREVVALRRTLRPDALTNPWPTVASGRSVMAELAELTSGPPVAIGRQAPPQPAIGQLWLRLQ